MSPEVTLLLLAWGTLVGVDLASFPQGMLNRPLVAGAGAGLLVGDVAAGLVCGAALELFELDVLPIGAARYPDFGPPTVAAVAAAAGLPWRESFGGAVILALGLGVVAGWGMEALRRLNGRRVRRADAELASGNAALLARLQRWGLVGDAVRSALVTGAGLVGFPPLVGGIGAFAGAGSALGIVVVAGGVIAATNGLLRRAGTPGRRWAGVGLLAGVVFAWLL